MRNAPPRPQLDRTVVAVITKSGWGYNIRHTVGPGKVEPSRFAWTLKGAERKARRISERLARSYQRQTDPILTITHGAR